MSQLSREEVIGALKIVQQPEVFSDPPAFIIENFIRQSSKKDTAEVKKVMVKFEGTNRPLRTKALLDDFLRDSDLDPQ